MTINPRALPSDIPLASGSNRVNNSNAAVPNALNRATLQIRQIIQPGATLPFPVSGSFFYVAVSTATLQVRPSNGSNVGTFVEYQQGTGLNLGIENSFTSLEVRNTNAAAVVFVIVYGFDGFIDNRLVIDNSYVEQAVYATYGVANSAMVIDITDRKGTSFTDPNGVTYYAINRVAIMIGNTDTGVTLQLQKAAATAAGDTTIMPIYPLTSLNYPAGGNWRIRSAANLNCFVSEIYQAVRALT